MDANKDLNHFSDAPKVLIIGQYFEKRSGGGITMRNLFNGWDPNKIAVVARSISQPDFSACSNYYQLGKLEIKNNHPFDLLFSGTNEISGTIVFQQQAKTLANFSAEILQETLLQRIKKHLLYITGQIHRLNTIQLSDELKKWIQDFSPDIIYSQLSSYELIRFVSLIHKEIRKPIIIHMMDDWPMTITSKQWFPFNKYWFSVIDNSLRGVFRNSGLLLGISEAMQEAFRQRYRREFVPFHNPISTEEWERYTKKDWHSECPFKILYTGRIGRANNQSILFFSRIIDKLNQHNSEYQLDIYSPKPWGKEIEYLNALKGVKVHESVAHEKVPSLFTSYDLLFLPLDFDRESVRFSRYSMPTKASEYMISATPILVFASAQTGLAKSAIKHGWGYVVDKNDRHKLVSALTEIRKNELLRKRLGTTGREYALKNENANLVRKHFKEIISQVKNKMSDSQQSSVQQG